MIRRPPRSTRTDTLFPYTTLFRSLTEGWEDKAFCARYVSDLDALRSAVEPFTPDYVADRAGIDAGELRRAASLFAKESRRGGAAAGTGPSMADRKSTSLNSSH